MMLSEDLAMPPLSGARPLGEAEAAGLLAPLAAADRVLLAVSGGADSLALMVLAARWAAVLPGRPALAVATVDHGLRTNSAAEAAHVGGLAASLGLPHAILAWRGRKPTTGIEEAARGVRYRLLAAHARKIRASHLATAHTLDDQAETVLLRLAAGSGPAGLAAMRAATPLGPLTHVRPLLGVPKGRLVATLREAGIAWCEDETNRDPAFARARLRAAKAALAREGLTDARLARLATRAARAEDALAAVAVAFWQQSARADSRSVEIDGAMFLAQPEEIRLRTIGRAVVLAGGGDVRLARLEALGATIDAALASGKRAVRTLAGARVESNGRRLRVTPAPPRRA
ncbi:MAG TPA: tRNA lysidine(34) synthetase TilS [Hyphomicrobiales bacterium]|nr:tRNA lysidine(34) synthetase TilS [Hyphomicrobiales bacterium]